MSDESGDDTEGLSEISDMGSDSDDEDGGLMNREAVKDTRMHTKRVSVSSASEVNVSVIGEREGAPEMSPYEKFRQKNIQERQDMFRDTFREIDELKNSLMSKKKAPAPRHNQPHEIFTKRRSERIVVQESRKELLSQKSKEEQENETQKVEDKPSDDPPVSCDLVDLVKVKCGVCEVVVVEHMLRHHCRQQHSLSMPQYKEEFGPPKVVRKVKHKCALCERLLNFSIPCIAHHLTACHKGINRKEYTAKFLVDTRSKSKSMSVEDDKGVEQPGDMFAPFKLHEDWKETAMVACSLKPQANNVVKSTKLPKDWKDRDINTLIASGLKPHDGSIIASVRPIKELSRKQPQTCMTNVENVKDVEQSVDMFGPIKINEDWKKKGMTASNLKPHANNFGKSTKLPKDWKDCDINTLIAGGLKPHDGSTIASVKPLKEDNKDTEQPGDMNAPVKLHEDGKEKAMAASSLKPQANYLVKSTKLPKDWKDRDVSTLIAGGLKTQDDSIISSVKPMKEVSLEQPPTCIRIPVKPTKDRNEKTLDAGNLIPQMTNNVQPSLFSSEVIGLGQLQAQQTKILELTSQNNTMLQQQLEIMKTKQLRKERGTKRKLAKLQELVEIKEDQINNLIRNEKSTYKLYNEVKQVLEVNQEVNKAIAEELESVNTELETMKKCGRQQVKGLKRTRRALTSACSAVEGVEERTGQMLATVARLNGGPGLVKPLKSRVDKMMCLSVETRENQTKMNMLLGELLIKPICKEGDVSQVVEKGVKESLPLMKTPQIGFRSKNVMWGYNVALVGDGFLRNFYSVEEVRAQLMKMEKEANLLFLAHKGASLASQLYSLPQSCRTVVLSQGQGCLFFILWIEPYPEEITFGNIWRQDWFFCGGIFFWGGRIC